MRTIPKEFVTCPIVYAVGNTYQIIVPVNCETVMWVQVGDRCFYDDSNGVFRSNCTTHRMTVPVALLEQEKHYTVCYRVIRERKPYFTDAGDVLCFASDFRPPTRQPLRIYQIADAHNRVETPIAAAKHFEKELDLLILNGDIPNHSGDISHFTAIHRIAAELTEGEIPVVFSRGNHDTRGVYAEDLADHTPTDAGRSYYTFRTGHVWGIVLDCGEDKDDNHPEHGHTVCCTDFRQRQTAFIREVIENRKAEYEADGVKNRLVVCHIPFTEKNDPPFEEDIYAEWTRLLREHIHPQLMLCGHIHECYVSEVGCERDYRGQPCPVVVASNPEPDGSFWGGGLTLLPNRCRVEFTHSNGETVFARELLF